VLNQRDALYYIMTGETFDGKRAKEIGLVNEAVPKEKLARTNARARTDAVGEEPRRPPYGQACLPHARDMAWDNRRRLLDRQERSGDLARYRGGRAAGMRQFLDEKSYKPGSRAV